MGLWLSLSRQPSPFEEAAANELHARLEHALAELPQHIRELLQLSVADELTSSEIAQICGVAPTALRQRLCRARAMLVRRLTDPDEQQRCSMGREVA